MKCNRISWIFRHRKDLIKILITIKLVVLFTIVNNLQVYGSVYSESTRLNVQLKNASMADVFKAIEDQSEFKFLYHDALISEERNLNLEIEGKTVEEILDIIFEGSNNTYSVLDNNLVVITPKNTKALQERVVTGTVSDENGEPLPGVNIVIKGTTQGTITDVEGKYQISVPSEDVILLFSSVGYSDEEIPVSGLTTINISMVLSIESLEEVVVIGYGSVTKRELTGAVASVKEDDFNPGSVSNPMQLVQGKVAGLTIVRPNGGDPTSGYEVLLRGTSSIKGSAEPLIVIDGIPGGDLATIAPDDIESIDVLKDGSAAAIYGTRGTNGVILITTKKGEKGRMQVEFSSSYFTERVLRRIEVLDADEYRQVKQDWAASGDPIKESKAESMIDYGYNIDWFDEIIRNPFSHKQHLSLSGGSDKSNYRLSFDYVDQEGILLESQKREYKINYNMQHLAINDRVQFNAQLGLINGYYHPVDYNSVRQTIQRNPTEPVYNPDGTFFELDQWQYLNPVALLKERTSDTKLSRYYVNLGTDLNITKSLKFSVITGLQVADTLGGYYEPSYTFTQQLAGTDGYAKRDMKASSLKTIETTLNWRKEFGKHNINLIGGYSFQEFIYEGFSADNTSFITDETLYNNLELGTYLVDGQAKMESFKLASRLIGFFARASYHYAGKYFLSASIRREGSSKFGKDRRWGTFPAVSIAWDISQESFMQNISVLQQLKIRAGYGVTGNQGLEDPYIPYIRYGSKGLFYYAGNLVQGYEPISNSNTKLQWETKHETNIGIDWLIFNSRLGGSIDLYRRDTKDLLEKYDVPTPPNLYNETWQNVGSMRSSGIEFSINAIPLQQDKFKWTINFVFDYRKNTVLSLSNNLYSFEYRNIGDVGPPGISAWTHRLEEGEPLGNIHALVYEGIDEEGKWIFRDYDPLADTVGGTPSDGNIDTKDRAVVGNGIPDYFMGLTNTFQYANFDLSVMLRGMFGYQVINAKRIWHDNPTFLPQNVFETALDEEVWDEPQFSSYYVEDADFVKIDNITLGFTHNFKNVSWISSARIYTTVLDAFLFTKYSGLDPEVSIQGLEPGNDNRFEYPSTRTFLIGFNFKF